MCLLPPVIILRNHGHDRAADPEKVVNPDKRLNYSFHQRYRPTRRQIGQLKVKTYSKLVTISFSRYSLR